MCYRIIRIKILKRICKKKELAVDFSLLRRCVCVAVMQSRKSALGEHMAHALISRCVSFSISLSVMFLTVPLSGLSELNRYETQHFVSQIFTFNVDKKKNRPSVQM